MLRVNGWFFCFVLFAILRPELRTFTLSHSTSPFLWRVFLNRISQTISPGWLQTMILLISASWEPRITSVSHWCPAVVTIFIFFFKTICSSSVLGITDFKKNKIKLKLIPMKTWGLINIIQLYNHYCSEDTEHFSHLPPVSLYSL
jgi:hypothetical protein